MDHTRDIQIPIEEVFEPSNISALRAFQRSKHLLTKHLEDFGCLGISPGSIRLTQIEITQQNKGSFEQGSM